MKILFASSEAHPLMKTGGLADVAGSLPPALKALKQDIRLIMPAYPQATEQLLRPKVVAELKLTGHNEPVQIIEGQSPLGRINTWLVDAPSLFQRPGNPYNNRDGQAWPDNAERFALFCRAICALALNEAKLKWQPDVVHCNDWQTGLVPALLAQEPKRPATVFTIHNLAYSGTYDWDVFQALKLPYELWSVEATEFYGSFSFLKGGIACADHVTTVSPTYAREICTTQFGNGLEGLLQHRSQRLSGILNGVDYRQWDPKHDTLIAEPFSASAPEAKANNKQALQRAMGLPERGDIPLIGHIGRLVDQKGVDLIIDALPALLEQELQFVILGSGQSGMEQAIREQAEAHPDRIAVHIGYDEALAHQVEAGADMFLMPSRFEPCGLNQIYSLRYGTVPIVHRVGGLADTIIDTLNHTLGKGIATGFVFDDPSAWAVQNAVERAVSLYRQPEQWRKLMHAGMRQDFSWRQSAQQYLALYTSLADKSN